MSTRIVIYFDGLTGAGRFFSEPEYQDSYTELARRCRRRGADVFFVYGASQYLGNMRFAQGWSVDDAGVFLKVEHEIVADIIYRKGSQLILEDTAHAVNHNAIEAVGHDKWKTYELFHEYMTPMWRITKENARDVIAQATTETVLIKPRSSWGGAGIIVTTKQAFTEEMMRDDLEYVCEEFVETKTGIPGLVVGRHDLRLYLYNGIPRIAEIRQPKGEGVLANVALGGSLFEVAMDQLPAWALDMVPVVEKHFGLYHPRMYTIDMLYGNGQPYIVEVNEKPGMPWREWSYFDRMLDFIVETLCS